MLYACINVAYVDPCSLPVNTVILNLKIPNALLIKNYICLEVMKTNLSVLMIFGLNS